MATSSGLVWQNGMKDRRHGWGWGWLVLGDLGDLGVLQNRKPTLSGMVYYELGKGLDSSSHLQSA